MTESAFDMRQPPSQVRIGLLSPYRGTNLGDGAIHIALIENLRRLFTSVEIVGINLDPARTSTLHNIRCEPITGLPVASYWLPSTSVPAQGTSGASEPSGPPARSLVKRAIHAAPIAGPCARAMMRVARGLPAWRHEVRHLRSSFRLCRQLDLLIIAGGGQIDETWGGPWGHPYALFRWAALSRLAGTPVIVLSVGVSTLPSRLGRFLVAMVLASAAYRSYRTAESKGLLSGLRFTRQDPCVPDLAFSLTTERHVTPRPPRDHRVVAVSPISYGHSAFSPTPQPEVYDAYIRQLAAFVNRLIARGFDVVLFNSGGSDRTAIEHLAALVNANIDARAATDQLHVVFPPDVASLLTELAAVDYVVASRLHGVLLSHVLAKPALAISFDPKVDAHMRDMGQSTYVLSIETVTARDLERLFAELEQNREPVTSVLAGRRESFRQRLDTQYEAVVGLLPGDAPRHRPGLVASEEWSTR